MAERTSTPDPHEAYARAALALAEAAGTTEVSAGTVALLKECLPQALDLGIIVEARANGDFLRVYVADLLEAGHKQLALLGPPAPGFEELRNPETGTVAQSGKAASKGQILSANVWSQPFETGQSSTVHVLQAILVACAAGPSDSRETQQHLKRLASALSACLLPHAQGLAEAASVSLLGRLPGRIL